MKKLLTLKHWQLFSLFVGLPLLPFLIFILFILLGKASKIIAVLLILLAPLLLISCVWVFLGWLYISGTNLHKRLPHMVNMNLKRFKIAFYISIVALLLRAFLEMCAFLDIFSQSQNSEVMFLDGLFSLFSAIGILYCMYFDAKALKAVEWQAPVIFSDFAGNFLSILFFPIGVWEIQPRINRLFAAKNTGVELGGVAGQL